MDFVRDETKSQFRKLCEALPLPEFVKEAEMWDEEGLKELPSSAFAGTRTFPTHTKAATWLSCGYFAMNQDELSDTKRAHVETGLRKAASEWGIDFDSVLEQYKEATAEPDPEYALETEYEGKPVKLCPMPNRESVKQAAVWLEDNKTKLPYGWRRKIAQAVLDKASEYELILPNTEYLHKAAGYGAASTRDMAVAYMTRARLVDSEGARDVLEKIAGEIYRSGFDYDDNQEYAEKLAEVDEIFGLTRLYDHDLPMPEEVAFATTLKYASEILDTSTTLANGKLITDEQVERAPIMKAARAIGGEFRENLSSTILPSVTFVKEALLELSPKDADTFMLFVPADDRTEKVDFIANG